MQIVFIHQSKAFLPELDAYTRFFRQHNFKTAISNGSKNTLQADVEWYFMGTYPKRRAAITIHEYASASVPPFAAIKDVVKRSINAIPDFRIYQNDYVRGRFGFNDDIPSGMRDMGYEAAYTSTANEKKAYDFIYIGSLAPHRKLNDLLRCFTTGALREHSLLLLSKQYTQQAIDIRKFRNIQFAGPVPPQEVRKYLHKAHFGINYIVDEPPFNQQTSGKLIEYAAAALPIISNSYAWVNQFEAEYGGSFFKLNEDFSNFTWERVNNFAYKTPDLTGWTWDEQIRKSGVLEFLLPRSMKPL